MGISKHDDPILNQFNVFSADRTVSKATLRKLLRGWEECIWAFLLIANLVQCRSKVLRAVRQHLQQLEEKQEHHHSVDRLLKRDVHKGSGRWSTLQGPERALINQTNMGTVSKETLGKLLKGGEEHIWAFPSAIIPS